MHPVDTLLAALPIAALAVALAFRAPAIPAVLGAIALVFALTFRFPLAAQPVAETSARMGPLVLSVSLIIIGGMVLAEFMIAAGAQQSIGDWLIHLADSPSRAVLLLGCCAGPLVESLIGWGVGVLIAVPLLVRAGLSAGRAAAAGLLGMVLAPWGSLAPSLLIAAEMSTIPLQQVGVWAAVFSGPVIAIFCTAILVISKRGRPSVKEVADVGAMAAIMWVSLIAANAWLTVPTAGVVAAAAGGAYLLLPRVFTRNRGDSSPPWRALTPYLVLLLGLSLSHALREIVGSNGATDLLAEAATWILVAAALAPWLLRMRPDVAVTALRTGAQTVASVLTVTLLFISFGALLSANGMSAALANGAAAFGAGFGIVVPFLGMIGGYVTASSSATASMFAEVIRQAADVVGTPPTLAVGALSATSGSAVILSPPRITIAAAIAVAASVPRPAGASAPRPIAQDTRRITRSVLAANAAVLAVVATALVIATAL